MSRVRSVPFLTSHFMRALVDEGVDDVAISVRLLCGCNRGIGGVAADAVEALARSEVTLCDGDALAHGAVQWDDGRLAVDDDLRHAKRRLKVAEMIGTVQRPEGAVPHLEIVHHIRGILIRTCDGDKDPRRNAVDILDNAVAVQNTAILLETKCCVEVGTAIR